VDKDYRSFNFINNSINLLVKI